MCEVAENVLAVGVRVHVYGRALVPGQRVGLELAGRRRRALRQHAARRQPRAHDEGDNGGDAPSEAKLAAHPSGWDELTASSRRRCHPESWRC